MINVFPSGLCSLHPLKWDAAVWLEDGRNTWTVLPVIEEETVPAFFSLRNVGWQ